MRSKIIVKIFFAKFVRNFREICEIRSNIFDISFKILFFRKNTILLMRNRKISIFIERKFYENFAKMKIFRENEIENFVENTSKFAKIEFHSSFSRISFDENFDGNPNLSGKGLKGTLLNCTCPYYKSMVT